MFDYDVFVTYRWIDPDQKWVRTELVPALRAAGLRVCVDVEDFVPGLDIMLEMERVVIRSRQAICVITSGYFEGNRMVSFESLLLRRHDPSGSESRLIPLILCPTELPERLRGLIHVDWTDPGAHPREWRRLLRALNAPLTESQPPGVPRWPAPVAMDEDPFKIEVEDLRSELCGIREDIQALRNAISPTPTTANTSNPSQLRETEELPLFSRTLFDDVDTHALEPIEVALSTGDTNALFRLEQFRIACANPKLATAASMLELEYLLEHRDFSAVETVAERGAEEAHAAGMKAEEALFRSHLVRMLVMRGSDIETNIAAAIRASREAGVILFDLHEVESANQKVADLYARGDSELQTALALAKETANLHAMYLSLYSMAFSEAHKAQSARLLATTSLPAADFIEGARRRAKAAHETAIRTAHRMDDVLLAQAYHNYANDLRLFHETERALYFAREGRTIAERVGYTYQLNLSDQLIQALEGDLRRSKP